MTDLTLAQKTTYYVLFFSQELAPRYPGVAKGTSFPIGLERPMETPQTRGVSYGLDDSPEALNKVMWISERWYDPAQLSKAYVDLPVRSKSLPELPDIFLVKSLFVSTRAKAVLQAFDPEIAYFYAAHVKDADTGAPAESTFWGCLPRRRIHTQVKRNWDAPDYTDADGPTGRALPALHWVPGALEYLTRHYPLLEDSGDTVCMNSDLFHTLQDAGLSGLSEIPLDARSRIATRGEIYDAHRETVAHVFWPGSDTRQQ